LFDVNEWRKNLAENFLPRLDALTAATVAAPPDQRSQAGLDLPDFYMAHGMYEEAHGLANLILSETKQGTEEAGVMMVRAVSGILIGRPDRGLKDLANPAIGNGYDSQLWQALAFASQGKWAASPQGFTTAEFSIAGQPLTRDRIGI